MRTYGHDDEIGREETLDEYIEGLVEVFREVKRLLREDGVVWLVLGDTYTSGNRTYRANDKKSKARAMTYRPPTPLGLKEKDLIGLPWRVAFALQADGWYLRTDIVWAKPNPTPESVRDRPHRSHEFIFLLTKAPNYFFDKEAFAHPMLGKGCFGKSVWTVPVGRRRASHPAAFPLELITPCVISSTRPGGLILDPFAGSGSVGLASLRVGRRFVGIEIVQEHVELANAALAAIAQQNIFRPV
jgi:DNA modification methylase